MFALPSDEVGRYACAEKGLVLLTGSRQTIGRLAWGARVLAQIPDKGPRDNKTGALVVRLEQEAHNASRSPLLPKKSS
jgi:hypothetical protein